MPTRIVLIGYGPVGARFVEEMLPAVRAGLASVTVLGAEPHDAYNRVLLAEYAVGRTSRERLELSDLGVACQAGVTISLDSVAVSLDRTRQCVVASTGEAIPYDRLVLATGARANIPTLDGIEHSRLDRAATATRNDGLDSAHPLPARIVALRSLDDAEKIRQSMTARQRIIVLGAGVLGMEFALAASEQGAEVAVLYHGDTPMERNLDRGAGRILADSARRAGVTMSSHSRAESVVMKTRADGTRHFDALLCADGKQLRGELLVISCGVSARTELAARAGLRVSRGILVDEECRTWSDPDVYAIGDCAHVVPRREDHDDSPIPGGPSGLIGPGWRQAEWLASMLSAELRAEDRPALLGPEHQPVVMLKSEWVNVCSAGETALGVWDDHPDLEASEWADPARGAYAKVVTRAEVLVGFVCVGLPRAAAELTLLFERGSEVPANRAALLTLDGPAGGTVAVASLDDTACACNGVSGRAITEAASCGATTVALIGSATRAGTGCGGCRERIRELIESMPRVAATP